MSEPEETSDATIDRYSAFISHSSEDREVAEEVCAHLEQRGMRCWIAPRNVRAGRDYGEEIVRGIERSKCLILILSERANLSRPVKDEVERAYSKGKPVFPVRIEEVPPSPALELFISSSHWIDAWTGDLAQHVQRLAEGLAGEAEETPFQVTGRQIKRKLQSVGLAWPIVAGVAVLGLVLAIWRLSGNGHAPPSADEIVAMQDRAMEKLGETLGQDTTRLLQKFDPELITTENVALRVDGAGGRWAVQLEYPTWFLGQFGFRRNVRQLLYSTDGENYVPSANTRSFWLPQGTRADKLYLKYVLRDGTELDPLVYDVDLVGSQIRAAEAALAQQQSYASCTTQFEGSRGCDVMRGGAFEMIRGVLKNVQISENESFRGAVFTVPAQGDATRNLEYHPPPDAKHFFVRFELTNGETSRVYGVPIQSGAWPYWMKLQGKRERGDAKLDELGLGTLYVAYDPRNRMNPRWSFWGPFFDCRSMQLRYALDEKGLLAARCRSDALEVAAPGDSRLLLLEYKLSDGSSALYRFAVDYAHLALQGMLAGLDEMQDWLTCSARGGSRPQMTCQWGNEMQWRLPAVDRVEYGPTASDLSGQTPVPIDFEAFLAASNQTGQLYNATRMPVVDVKADWPDVFARLVLEDGHATDVKRMVVRR